MTDDTVFAIGSVSKSFTAAAVLRLVADGRLHLSDRAGDLVPGLAGPAAAATVEQLLTHTSGVHGDAGPDHRPLSAADAIASISDLPSTFAPGTDFGYTNAGYTLLALVIEQLTGDYREYLRSTLLAGSPGAGFWDGVPAAAGPRAVGYTEEGRSDVTGEFAGPHWATSGNGDLAMSVPTLAELTASLFRGELLPARATAQLEKPRWDHGDGTSETFGWVRYDARLFGAEGFAAAGGGGDTGHDAVVAYLPGADTAIAVASSTPDVSAEQLLQAIVPALVAGRPVPEPAGADVTAPDPDLVARMEGTYRVEDGSELVVRADPKGVAVEAVGDGAVDALFSLPAGVTTDDVAAHEAGVVALLTGDSDVGEDEREALSEALGGIDEVTLQGTIAQGSELRTYVLVTGSDKSLLLWYALDDQGGVGAAQGPAERPTLVLEQQHATRPRPPHGRRAVAGGIDRPAPRRPDGGRARPGRRARRGGRRQGCAGPRAGSGDAARGVGRGAAGPRRDEPRRQRRQAGARRLHGGGRGVRGRRACPDHRVRRRPRHPRRLPRRPRRPAGQRPGAPDRAPGGPSAWR
jgi:CubicO group peptidase (beta-lactamase class C family)